MNTPGINGEKNFLNAKMKVSIWVATGAVIILILLLALTINRARENEMVEQFSHQQVALARGIAAYIEDHIRGIEKSLVLLTRLPAFEKSDSMDIQTAIKDFYEGMEKRVHFIARVDGRDTLLEAYPPSLADGIAGSLERQNFSQRAKGVHGSFIRRFDRSQIRAVEDESVPSGMVVIGVPQCDVRGKYTGSILAGISLAAIINRHVRPVEEQSSHVFMIADEDGRVIVHSDHEMAATDIPIHLQRVTEGAVSSEGTVFEATEGYGEYVIRKGEGIRDENIVAYAPVRIGTEVWTAAIGTPYTTVISLVRKATVNVVLGAMGLIAVLVIAVMSIAYAGTRQLRLKEELRQLREREDWQEKLIRESKTIEGIMGGSPIPMFVIDRAHKVVLWNRACAELTGFDSEKMIGTDNQYLPFYTEKRPVIADLIVDNDIEGLERYYGKQRIRKSSTVEGAYEAQDFYEDLGGKSRHLYFLAAPICDDSGEIVAAIETLQDVTRVEEMAESLKENTETIKAELDKNITLRKTIEGIMEGSPIPMFVIDKDHRVIFWNRACAELTGFDSEEMIGTDKQYLPFYTEKRPVIADLIVDNDVEGLERYYGKQRIQKSTTVEGAYEARDFYEDLGGKSRHLYFLAAPIYDEKGEVVAAIETLQDMTRVEEMAKSLKEYTETIKAELDKNITLRKTIEGIMEGSPIPMFVIDKDHRVIFWNKACAKLTGFDSHMMIGTNKQYLPFYTGKRPVIADLIVDNDIEGLEKYYGKQRVQKSDAVEGAYEAQDFYENLGGKRRYLYFLATPISDEKGNVIAAIETLQDVSTEKEMELGLKEYAETLQNELMENITLKREVEDLYNYLSSIVESIPDKIFDLSSEGTVNYVSKGTMGVRELTLQEITGKHFTEFVDPENRELAVARWEEAKRGNFTAFEMEAMARDGSKRNLLLTPCPVAGTDRFVFVQRDITEFKNLEKKFYESQKLAAIGQLSAGIAHEVRNPLSSIKMSLQILQKRLDPKGNDLKRFEIAQREVEHLEKLVNDVLIYARPADPHKESSDLKKILLHALAMVEKSLSDKRIIVQTNFDDNISSVSVDPAMLEQAFINIYHNAIDAMDDRGSLVITTRLADKRNKSVVVEIEDNGCGIDEDDMPHIFNPFFTKKRYGTGLGMTQVKKLIDLHGGTIEIVRRTEAGTRLTITIPVGDGAKRE